MPSRHRASHKHDFGYNPCHLDMYVVERNKKIFELKAIGPCHSKRLEIAKRSTKLQGFSWAR